MGIDEVKGQGGREKKMKPDKVILSNVIFMVLLKEDESGFLQRTP